MAPHLLGSCLYNVYKERVITCIPVLKEVQGEALSAQSNMKPMDIFFFLAYSSRLKVAEKY